MLLYVVSSNLNTIYFPEEIPQKITRISLNQNDVCVGDDITHIVWEATDSDLFDYRVCVDNNGGNCDDRVYICSKFINMLNLIDSFCLLESISIKTTQNQYEDIKQYFINYPIIVTIQIIDVLALESAITSVKSKSKPVCISLRNKYHPRNLIEYLAKHDNISQVANYISVPLFTNYRRVELQRLMERSPLPILAVTAVANHNVFKETSAFREQFTCAIDSCRLLKAKYVIYGSSNTKTVPLDPDCLLHYNSYNNALQRFIAVMRDMSNYAKDFGIIIVIKPNRKTIFLQDDNDVRQVISMIGCENVIIGPRSSTNRNEIYTEYDDFIFIESEEPSFLDIVVSKLLID